MTPLYSRGCASPEYLAATPDFRWTCQIPFSCATLDVLVGSGAVERSFEIGPRLSEERARSSANDGACEIMLVRDPSPGSAERHVARGIPRVAGTDGERRDGAQR